MQCHRILLSILLSPAVFAVGGEDSSARQLPVASAPADELKEHQMSQAHAAHKFTNALSRETSPYLLQHAHNPVNWYPWGDEAFEKARKEDKPIFLSVGYSSCHWCHVMERESFENDSVAAILNKSFIAIKVDREERPDVDEIYMTAVQLVTQRGGWPMSIFMAPDGRPFFGGTYFPPEDMQGRMGFKTLLTNVADVWREKRADVLKDAENLSDAVRQHLSERSVKAQGPMDRKLVDGCVDELFGSFDSKLGGFGHRPKFPPNNGLPLLINLQARTKTPDPRIQTMTTVTMDHMARGGIHDQLAGGFHRYSTDDRWLVPHFEKMLYDNALLSGSYAEASVVYKKPEYAEVARGVYDWVLREMTSPEGAFYSTLDADSEGVEGKFYVWNKKEVDQLLGSDSETFCKIYNVLPEGNFEEEATGHPTGLNILNLTEPLSAHAARLKMDETALRQKTTEWKAKLLAVRIKRVWPGLDDKILTSWNGLMISSLARGSVLLQEPRYKDAAVRAADYLLKSARTPDGRWLATQRKGQSKLPAYLDDHAFMAVAFLDLFDATGDERWKKEAIEIVSLMDKHFTDSSTKDRGGYFFTADDHEKLLARTKDPIDKAIPSGNGWASQALVRLAKLTGDKTYEQKSVKLFGEFQGLMERAPQATESLLLGLATWLENGGETKADKADPFGLGLGAAKEGGSKLVKGAVTVEVFAGESALRRGAKVPIAIKFIVAEGYHIEAPGALKDGKPPADEGAVARFSITSPKLGAFSGYKFPTAKVVKFPELDEPLSIYEGEAVVGAYLNVANDAELGKQNLTVKVHFQACNDKNCQRPEDAILTLAVDVAAADAPVSATNEKVFDALKLGK